MTNKVALCSEEKAFDLLDQLERILDHDPLIDEVGFIHPSQLLMLNEEANAACLSPRSDMVQEAVARLSSEPSDAITVEGQNAFFWNRDHKLGISTEYLLPLYKAAKRKFMEAFTTYKMYSGVSMEKDNVPNNSLAFLEIENEVTKHSKALLLLSSDFGTVWNARKFVISKTQDISISDELVLSDLVLSFAPKSESAWSHRRWVIKRMAERCASMKEILEKESKLVEKIAEKSKMNYRAWNHRCWLISYMTSQQALCELDGTRNWAALHVADNSCFHYRRKLMLRMVDGLNPEKDVATDSSQFESLRQLWKDELDWNEMLIRRYIGREALWLHRRFLSVNWVKHFEAAQNAISKHPIEKSNENKYTSNFMDRELCLLQDSLNLPESEFEDVQSHAIHATSYFLWLNREVFGHSNINLNPKLGDVDLRTLLTKVCPEKTEVWNNLIFSPPL